MIFFLMTSMLPLLLYNSQHTNRTNPNNNHLIFTAIIINYSNNLTEHKTYTRKLIDRWKLDQSQQRPPVWFLRLINKWSQSILNPLKKKYYKTSQEYIPIFFIHFESRIQKLVLICIFVLFFKIIRRRRW